MNKFIILISSYLFLVTSVFAAESKLLTVEGTIKSFDKNVIVINTSKGPISIPRKFIAANAKLKPNDPIKIPLTEDQLQELK
jgi:hypothetical protein